MMTATGRRARPVFLGEYNHSLDEKGRLVMPRKFRPGLERGCVVTKGQDRCLFVFPLERREEEAEKVLSLPRTDRRARNFARSFFASASDQVPDRQGRVQIPESLRAYAGLEKDVTIVGMADHLELWSTETWAEVSADADAYYAEIGEVLSGDGGI